MPIGFNSFRVDELLGMFTQRSRWRVNAGLMDGNPFRI
jgi:hypothetical protein